MTASSSKIHDQTMCSRRGNSSLLQSLFIVTLFGSLVYCFLLYNSTTLQLEESKAQHDRSTRQRESLAAQLQVVYEHRAKLEKTLQREKNDHTETKQEKLAEHQEFLVNITRTKHEHMNRFNSLDTSHKMLKAQYDQLETEYMRLQQQHARVSSEHTTLYQQLSQNLETLKIQKRSEIAELEAQVATLQEQTQVLRTRVRTYQSHASQYKQLYEQLTKENGEIKKRLALLERSEAEQSRQTQSEISHRRTHEASQSRDKVTSNSNVKDSIERKDSRPSSVSQQSKSVSQVDNRQGEQRTSSKQGNEDEGRRRSDTHETGQSHEPKSSREQTRQNPDEHSRALGQGEEDVPLRDRGQQSVQVVKPSTQAPDQEEEKPTAEAPTQNELKVQNPEAGRQDGEGRERQERDVSQQRQFRQPEENERYLKETDVYDKGRPQNGPNESDEQNFEDALDDEKLSQPIDQSDDEYSRDEEAENLNDENQRVDQSQQIKAQPIKSQLDESLTNEKSDTNSRNIQEVVDDVMDQGGNRMVARPIEKVPDVSRREERSLERILL